MPLALYRNINDCSAFAIWHITEETDALLGRLPESDRNGSLVKHDKGQAEYAASRLLANILCERHGLIYQGIKKDDFDKPHLIGDMAHISISHSHPFAAVMIHMDKSCGIDIERPQEKIRRIAHKFMNTDEERWVDEQLENMTLVWSAKETLYKIHGRKKLAFKEEMMIFPSQTMGGESLTGVVNAESSEKKYNLGIERIEDFIITFLES
ncbi:MAG: 4'-phosphopantetheinyl transferase superfamily protein [Cyclobacteriaceae bacterium]